MKKMYLLLAMIFVVTIIPLAAQDIDIGVYKDALSVVAENVAPVLTLQSSLGGIWSDAYIGGFPHFGVGATVGAVIIKSDAIKPLFDTLEIALPEELSEGIPLPMATVNARLGGLFLPFDVGVKIGTIPSSLAQDLQMIKDFLLVGADVRLCILEDKFIIPAVSVGLGYNSEKATIFYVAQDFTNTFTLTDPTTSDVYNLEMTAPELNLSMETKNIDIFVQVSKNLLIFTPFAGAGVNYGWSSVTVGLTNELLLSKNGGPATTPTQADIDAMNQLLTATGGTSIPAEMTANGFEFTKGYDLPTVRLYAGSSFNLLFLHLDAMVIYGVPLGTKDFSKGTIGASLNLRASF